LLVAVFAFFYALVVIYKTLMFGDPVQGYPSLMVVVLFLGAVQLVGIGVLGEYLGRMFVETKNRPLYLLDEVNHASAVTVENYKKYSQIDVSTKLNIS
jgi:hypothetical protein